MKSDCHCYTKDSSKKWERCMPLSNPGDACYYGISGKEEGQCSDTYECINGQCYPSSGGGGDGGEGGGGGCTAASCG